MSDLAKNARLVLTAWTPSGEVFGGSAVPLFDELGLLRTGRQKVRSPFLLRLGAGMRIHPRPVCQLVFFVGAKGDGSLECATPGEDAPCDLLKVPLSSPFTSRRHSSESEPSVQS